MTIKTVLSGNKCINKLFSALVNIIMAEDSKNSFAQVLFTKRSLLERFVNLDSFFICDAINAISMRF